MQLSVKGCSIAASLLWGGAVLIAGIAHWATGDYGSVFLQSLSTIYPGYHVSRAFSDVLIGAAYAFVDGAFAGLAFSWLYNCFSRT